MKITAIIPARGNSKGILKKNITLFDGKPLVHWAISAAQGVSIIDDIIVTTDNDEIAVVAKDAGASVIKRPAEISDDTAASEEALLHTLEHLSEKPDLIVFLQCTSPLTESIDIENCINKLIKSNADSAFTASRTHQFIWREQDNAKGINHSSAERKRRQDLEQEFTENGAVYVMKTTGFLTFKNRFFGKTIISEMPKNRSWEIDDPEDLIIAEAIKKSNPDFNTLPMCIKAVVFDFDGVFTNNKVYLSEEGYETVRCDRSDGWGIGKLQKLNLKMAVMSSEVNSVVLKRCEKLNLECFHKLEDSKYSCFKNWCNTHNIDENNVIFIGNDENDIECLQAAGFGVVPSDAHQTAKTASNLILRNSGGNGAIRELADLITEHMKNESK